MQQFWLPKISVAQRPTVPLDAEPNETIDPLDFWTSFLWSRDFGTSGAGPWGPSDLQE